MLIRICRRPNSRASDSATKGQLPDKRKDEDPVFSEHAMTDVTALKLSVTKIRGTATSARFKE